MSEQQAQLQRVKGSIAELILEFFAERLRRGELRFRNRDLLGWIWSKGVECAPDSPARIMRLLSEEGELSYRVVDRSGSEYMIQSQHGRQGVLF